MRLPLIAALLLALGACVSTDPVLPSLPAAAPVPATSPRVAAENFILVMQRMEPVAESYCRQRGVASNCDFRIVVDDRPGQPPNAFQTLDRMGRPVIGFTLALIADARNADELAFVLGHEAAHHIVGHIALRQNLGADVAARGYSKDFELEADALGAEIALIAGFDPIQGSAFFDRLPDPGDKFLGSHPPNAQRKALVEATVRRLGGS